MAEVLKTNSFRIVGTLVSEDLKEKTSEKTGNQFISGSIIVQSTIDGKKNEFSVDLYSNKMTKDGAPNKMYESYVALKDLINKKIEVTGSIGEDRYYSTTTNQMVSRQSLRGRFVRGVVDTTEDSSEFTVGGFIVSELVEKKRKDETVYAYELTLGQANYREDQAMMLRLQVRPEDAEIIRGIQKTYKIGDTVVLNGTLNFIVETVTQTIENAFGAPTIRTYQNRYSSYNITGGSNPITDVEQGAYTRDLINSLVSAYKAKDVELKAAADNASAARKDVAEVTPERPAVTHRQVSLI